MSKKTFEINKAISELFELNEKIKVYSNAQNDSELENINLEIDARLKNLKFWVNSLYEYNGKSKSSAKQKSSRENGKKGGRPPKAVSELRKRKNQLEDEIIPELIRIQRNSLDFEHEEQRNKEIEEAQKELAEINENLASYKKS